MERRDTNPDYISAPEETEESINASVRKFWNRIKIEKENSLRKSVLYDYYDQLGFEEANEFLSEDDPLKRFKELLKETEDHYKNNRSGRCKTNKQLLIRTGYVLLQKKQIEERDYLLMLAEFLLWDNKTVGYCKEEILNLADWCQTEHRSNEPLTKLLPKIINALQDPALISGRAFKGTVSLRNGMLESIINYRMTDFFKDQDKNSKKKKGIDSLYLYEKYNAHHNTEKEKQPVSSGNTLDKKITDAIQLCKKLTKDTDTKLLIPIDVDYEDRCGLYVTGMDYFLQKEPTSGDKADYELYAGINIITITLSDSHGGITGYGDAEYASPYDLIEEENEKAGAIAASYMSVINDQKDAYLEEANRQLDKVEEDVW